MDITDPFKISVDHAARMEIAEALSDIGYLAWGKRGFESSTTRAHKIKPVGTGMCTNVIGQFPASH